MVHSLKICCTLVPYGFVFVLEFMSFCFLSKLRGRKYCFLVEDLRMVVIEGG